MIPNHVNIVTHQTQRISSKMLANEHLRTFCLSAYNFQNVFDFLRLRGCKFAEMKLLFYWEIIK